MKCGLINQRSEADMSTYLANYKDTQVYKDSTANQLKDLKLTLVEAKRWTRRRQFQDSGTVIQTPKIKCKWLCAINQTHIVWYTKGEHCDRHWI